MLSVELYDGSYWGWDVRVNILEGGRDGWVEVEGFHCTREQQETVRREIGKYYKTGKTWRNATSEFIELPHARSVERLEKVIIKILSLDP